MRLLFQFVQLCRLGGSGFRESKYRGHCELVVMGDGHAENGSVESTLDTIQDLLNSIVYPCHEATNLADHLVIIGKGNLKWEGSFEALKCLNAFIVMYNS